MRIRIYFSKTGLASFIAHTSLPMLFARSARRAGLCPLQSEGFTPRARLALAPPLPVGVQGLCEPADFWFREWDEDSFAAWRGKIPTGIGLLSYKQVQEGSTSLSKLCLAATYRLSVGDCPSPLVSAALAEALAAKGLLALEPEGEGLLVTVSDIERNSASSFVKVLIAAGLAGEWSDFSIVRTAIGGWQPQKRMVIGI